MSYRDRIHPVNHVVKIPREVFARANAHPDDTYFAVANSNAVDLASEVVLPEGCDSSYFRRFPSLHYNHNSDILPVGQVLSWTRTGPNKSWLAAFVFGNDEESRKVRGAVDDGRVRGVSIGFWRLAADPPTREEERLYPNAELICRRWRMHELSVVQAPCNPDCRIDLGIRAQIGTPPKRVIVVPRTIEIGQEAPKPKKRRVLTIG